MSLTESQTRYVNFYTDFAFKKLFGTEVTRIDGKVTAKFTYCHA